MYRGACIPDGAVGRESHTFDAPESAVNDHGINSCGDTEPWNVLLEGNMDRVGDAARDKIVDTVSWGVKWITDHDAAESLVAQFATFFVMHFGEDNAPETAELGRVGRIGREEGEWSDTIWANGAAECAVAEVHDGANCV
jgi:hypothetical protein